MWLLFLAASAISITTVAGQAFTTPTLGSSYCGEWLYYAYVQNSTNPFNSSEIMYPPASLNKTGQCAYPVQVSYPLDLTRSPPTQTTGPGIIILQPSPAMPPFYPFPGGSTAPGYSYFPEWNGETLDQQMSKPWRFPYSYTFIFPSCASEIGFIEQDDRTKNVSFYVRNSNPALADGEIVTTYVKKTPDGARGRFLINFKPACALSTFAFNPTPFPTFPQILLDVACKIDDGGNCFSTNGRIQTPFKSLSYFPVTNGQFLTTPLLSFAQYYMFGAYQPLALCAGSGIDDDFYSPTVNFAGTGVFGDQGAPDPHIFTATYFPPKAFENYTEPIMLYISGVYNTQDYAMTIVDWDEFGNMTTSSTNRPIPTPLFNCQDDAPRTARSPVYSPTQLAQYSPVCRITFPYDPSIDKTAYLEATNGVFQPRREENWVESGTEVYGVLASNLPGPAFAVYVNVAQVMALPYLINQITGSNSTFDPLVNLTNVDVYLGNGEFYQYTQHINGTNADFPAGAYLFLQFGNTSKGFLLQDYPFNRPWLPACACNTTAERTDGNVVCTSDYSLIRGRRLTQRNLETQTQGVIRPECRIDVASPYFAWFGNQYGYVLQNTIYGLVANITNGDSTLGFSYQWYVNSTGGNIVTFDSTTIGGPRIVVTGSNNVTIAVAVRSLQTGLSTTCHANLTVLKGCPNANIVVQDDTIQVGQKITLDGSGSFPPFAGVPLIYNWTILSAYPTGAENNTVFLFNDRPSVPFLSNSIGVFVILLSVSTDTCTANAIETLVVLNGTNDFRVIGNPDNVIVPDTCFQNFKFNQTLPDTGQNIETIVSPPNIGLGPISGGVSTQNTGEKLLEWYNAVFVTTAATPSEQASPDLVVAIVVVVFGLLTIVMLAVTFLQVPCCPSYLPSAWYCPKCCRPRGARSKTIVLDTESEDAVGASNAARNAQFSKPLLAKQRAQNHRQRVHPKGQ